MNTNTQTPQPRVSLKILVAAATLVAAFAGGARAADVPQVHVTYADLNLHTPGGVATLNRRIKAAAQRVCDGAGDRDLARRARFDACTTRAIAAATASIKAATTQVASIK